MHPDLYDILDVAPHATQQAIAAAYRRLVLRHHPDRNNSAEATTKTAQINHAYRILSDPAERARYDTSRTKSDVPRVILGTAKLMIYELQDRKPRHGQVRWQPGIWNQIATYFPHCRDRGCLVLLRIDPKSYRQLYQHGDPGPTLEIDPNQGEFRLLQPWLEECHRGEDARAAARR